MTRLRRGSERAKRAVVGLGEAIVVSGDRVGVACITKRPKKNILGITYYTFLRSAMHVKTDKNIIWNTLGVTTYFYILSWIS